MTAINGNAILRFSNRESYQESVEFLNNYEGYTSHPELCEPIYKMFFANDNEWNCAECVKDVWIRDDYYHDNPLSTWHKIGYLRKDSLCIGIDASSTDLSTESIENELRENIDLSEGIERVSVSEDSFNNDRDICISIRFSTSDHEKNYQKCSEITSFLKKYNIYYSNAQIESYGFEEGYYDLNTINFNRNRHNDDEFILLSDEKVKSIDEDLQNQGFNVHLGQLDHLSDTIFKYDYYLIFDNVENMTEEEKYAVASYVYEKYDKYPLFYYA